MLTGFDPRRSQAAAAALSGLAGAVPRMDAGDRALWRSHLSHAYGSLDGQRGLTSADLQAEIPALAAQRSLEDMLVALHTFFVLACDVAAAAAASGDHRAYLARLGSLPARALERELEKLSSGRCLEEHGFSGGLHAFAFDWYARCIDASGLGAIRALAATAASCGAASDLAQGGDDPLGTFYAELMPRNLRHVLGEVYTPPWLAELLIADSGWWPGQRLIDPYAGSGVFLTAALRRAASQGHDVEEAVAWLLGIDLNPVACAAARANLVLFLCDAVKDRGQISLPILCADSLAPAIRSGQPSAADPSQRTAPMLVDGQHVAVPEPGCPSREGVARGLRRYGLRLPSWLPPASARSGSARRAGPTPAAPCPRDRRDWEQRAALRLEKADVLATNPPWVGWEYQSRAYRAHVQPGWDAYRLYQAGPKVAYLKDDLSTLALVGAWDAYLREGGTSVAVLRKSAMTSELAAQGLRRLSIHPGDGPLCLERVRVFEGIRVFPFARTDAATWRLTKGKTTCFPVACESWSRRGRRWQPVAGTTLAEVLESTTREVGAVTPIDPALPAGRWMVGSSRCSAAAGEMIGEGCYRGRTGVFTGGANAVFYLERLARRDGGRSRAERWHVRNVVARAKRSAPQVEVTVERELVYEVVRGRDIRRWAVAGSALMLCPHTAATRMNAIPQATMKARYPLALAYLESMRSVLDARRGFARWEQGFRERAFYAIQRIGAYTFAPYKVAWKYIAADFIVTVVGPDAEGRPRLPNDKVMFVALEDDAEAFYLAGLLSSSPVRWRVNAHTSGRQISTTAIASLRLPRFDRKNALHRRISAACAQGHRARSADVQADISGSLQAVDRAVAQLYGWTPSTLRGFQAELQKRGLAD